MESRTPKPLISDQVKNSWKVSFTWLIGDYIESGNEWQEVMICSWCRDYY